MKTKEDRKAFEKDKEAFERHMKYVIQFFNILCGENQKKKRLNLFLKILIF